MAKETNKKDSNIYSFKASIIGENYYNPETQWGVFMFSTEDDIPGLERVHQQLFDETIDVMSSRIVGKMQQLYLGSEYLIKAKSEYNTKYSQQQYSAISVVAIVPKKDKDKLLYIGALTKPEIANQLVEQYPNIIEDIMNGDITRDNFDTSTINGLGKKTWAKLCDSIMQNYVISDIITMLQPLGVTFNMIQKLIDNEPNPALLKQKLIDDPYMITNIRGIGFKKADDLALKLNPDKIKSNERLTAYLKCFLEEIGNNDGHVWFTENQLRKASSNNVPECMDLLQNILDNNTFLHIEGEENKPKSKIGLKYTYNMEKFIYKKLVDKQDTKDITESGIFNLSEDEVNKAIADAEVEQGFRYTDEQKTIIDDALHNNIAIISGVAGSGKSTIARGILKAYTNKGLNISCMAMSAKAAQRITETTGLEATTIHRGLGAIGLSSFIYNEENQLPVDVVFVDECSMINSNMYYNLLKAIGNYTRIIFVGDALQLPPIGMGNIFLDILKNDTFRTYKLTEPMRQAKDSGILSDANQIRVGINPLEKPEPSIKHGKLFDMFYKFRGDKEQLHKLAIKMYMQAIETDGIDDTALIIPRKRGCLNSTYTFNRELQELIIKDKSRYIQCKDMKLYIGSKVIQTKNDYKKDVFNGDTGYVDDFYSSRGGSKNDIAVINFGSNGIGGQRLIEYSISELNSSIELAYSLTVHKYQGSEAKTVIGVIDTTHYILLDRCLLYTLITRSKGRCMIIAEPQAFIQCIKADHNTTRRTWLREFNKNILKIIKKPIDK